MRDFKIFTLNDVVRFNDYHLYPFKGITKRIEDEDINNTDILYWEPLEPIDAPFSYDENSKGISEFEALLKTRNIKIYSVYSDYSNKTFNIDNVIIIRWKTSLLHYCNNSATNLYNGNITDVKINDTNFTKLFNSLNRGVRESRVILLDELYKKGLFTYGDISWNMLTTDEPFIDYNLKFNHWKEERLVLDLNSSVEQSDDTEIYDNQLWTDYYLNSNCLFTIQSESIVGSSFNSTPFLSEKTWKPLLLGQPFLIISSAGYYEYLQSLGFKLYDEIIDYSFDSSEDVEFRIKSMVNQLESLKDKDYNELYLKIKDKVIYNRNRCIEIVKKDTYISDEFIELYKTHQTSFDNLPHTQMNMSMKEIFGLLK